MPNMVLNLLIIREIFKGDHNAAAAAMRKLRRKQISALSGTLNYSKNTGNVNIFPTAYTGSMLIKTISKLQMASERDTVICLFFFLFFFSLI